MQYRRLKVKPFEWKTSITTLYEKSGDRGGTRRFSNEYLIITRTTRLFSQGDFRDLPRRLNRTSHSGEGHVRNNVVFHRNHSAVGFER